MLGLSKMQRLASVRYTSTILFILLSSGKPTRLGFSTRVILSFVLMNGILLSVDLKMNTTSKT